MWRRMWPLLAGLVIFLCVPYANAESSVLEQVWQETIIDMLGREPFEVRQSPSLSELSSEKMPVVVYLHGCGGRGNSAHSHIRFFKLQGFVVFAPDHYTRDDARTECDISRGIAWAGEHTKRKRIEEAAIVRDKLRQIDWVDQDNVYLVGHSQGGWAAAHYRTAGDFKGIISIAGACGEKPQYHTPLLTITASQDEFMRGSITCDQYPAMNANHLLVDGGDHNFILDTWLAKPERRARDAILKFMNLPPVK